MMNNYASLEKYFSVTDDMLYLIYNCFTNL